MPHSPRQIVSLPRPWKRSGSILAWLCLLASLFVSGPASSGYGVYVLGPGVKSVAMGGLSYVLGEESYIYSTNPALGAALDDRLDFGLDLEMVRPRVTIRDNLLGPDQQSVSRYQYAPIPQFGLSQRLNPQWAWGMTGFFAGAQTDYKASPYRRFGGDERSTIALPQAGIAIGTAWEPVPGQAFGASLNLGYNALFVKGVGVFSTLSDQAERFSNQGSEGTPSIGYTLGWYGRLGPYFAAGLSYRSKSYAERIKGYAGLLPDRGRFEFPALYGGGVAWLPRADLNLGIEYQRIDYESERAFGNRIDNLYAGHRFGSRNGPGFGWRNIGIVKLGLAWDPRPGLTLRLGYAKANRSTMPADQTLLGALAPSFARTHFTGGLSLSWSQNYELSLTGSYVKERSLRGNNSIPLIIRTGPGGLVPIPIGGGEADLHNPQSQISFSVGRKF